MVWSCEKLHRLREIVVKTYRYLDYAAERNWDPLVPNESAIIATVNAFVPGFGDNLTGNFEQGRIAHPVDAVRVTTGAVACGAPRHIRSLLPSEVTPDVMEV
jgi:hypothetical protein